MTNRWIRFLLAVLAIAAAAAAAYRVVLHEQQLARDGQAVREAVFAADTALASVEELKATLHAYIAPGQGADFWTARAQLLLDKTRTSLLALDAPATAAGTSMADALDACDRLAAAEGRAADYVRHSQPLLAGEVIFGEARDLIDGMRIQIARTRDQINSRASGREVDLRRQQIYLLAGGAGVLALVMLLLVPGGRSVVIEVSDAAEEERTLDLTPPPPPAPPAPTAQEPRPDAAALAAICSDIAQVAESRQLVPLLDRIRSLLEARGVIVWVATSDRARLQAAASSGYDERVLARIGSIALSESNLTADAFRDNSTRTSRGSTNTPAAIVVPLPAPGGPAGVFSAELTPGATLNDARLSAARVIAAQLAALLGSTGTKSPDATDAASATAAARSSS